MSSFKLRDYQVDLINRTRESIAKGNRCIVVQSPPRTGKTVTMAEIARLNNLKGGKVLFIAHRVEIVNQAKETFERHEADVDCMMVQTACRRELPEYNLILVDEAHHSLAKSYLKVMKSQEGAVKLLFTATPQRLGKQQLDAIATDIVCGEQIQTLIDKGFIAPFDYYSFNEYDDSKLKRTTTGDYSKASMDSAKKPTAYGDAVGTYKKLAGDKQAIAYCHSVKESKELSEAFNAAGISAAHCDGNTPQNEREELVRRFKNGDIKVMSNVELFTEGVDLPGVDCTIILRPTTSLALYLQFAMRCLNPREGKRAVIIDHVQNWKRFGLPNAQRDWEKMYHSTGGAGKKNGVPPAKECSVCGGVNPISAEECVLCGSEFKTKERNIETSNGKLVKIDKAEILQKDIWELKSYKELREYADAAGYKPGWAYYQAKIRGFLK